MIMLSLLCSANKLKTASLFQGIEHLRISESDLQRLEQQATDKLSEKQPFQRENPSSELALGQLFFTNFTTTLQTGAPRGNGRIFAPDWVARFDNQTPPASQNQTAQIKHGFQNLFDSLVRSFQDGGQPRNIAIAHATTEAQYHYQWMLMNLVLPQIIDENLQTEILNSKAPLYSEFRRENTMMDAGDLTHPKEFIFLIVPLALYLCHNKCHEHPAQMSLLYDLNLHSFPSAQAAIQDVFKRTGILLDPPQTFLNIAQMPIWLFLIDEMIQQDGHNMIGSLGSYILSDTIIGMLISDPQTYWHQPGSDAGRWSPDDGGLARPVDTLEKLLAL